MIGIYNKIVDFVKYAGQHPRLFRIIITIAVVVAIGLIWFSSGVLFGSDTTAPINADNYLSRMMSSWDYVVGYQDVRHLALWTYAAFCYPVFKLGMLVTNGDIQGSLAFLEFTQFITVGLTATLGISHLAEFILKNKKIKYDTAVVQSTMLIVSFAYLFSMWSMNFIWRAVWPYQFHLGFFPIFLLVGLKIISGDGNKKVNYLLLFLTLPLLLPSYSVPVSLAFDFIVLWALSMSLGSSIRKLILRSIPIVASILLLMMPFLLPAFIGDGTGVTVDRIISIASIESLLKLNSPSLIKSMAVTGYPPFYSHESMAWYNQMPLFNEALYIISFVLLLFIPLILKSARTDKTVLTLFGVYLLFITFMTSINAPYPVGETIASLYENNLMKLLRSTFVRFGEYAVFSALMMMVISWALIFDKYDIQKSLGFKRVRIALPKERTIKIAVVGLVLILVVPNMLTVVTKGAWTNRDETAMISPIHTNIPENYEEYFISIDKYSRESSLDNLIFSLPNNMNHMDWYYGPSLYYFGGWGRVIDADTEFDTYLMTISSIANGADGLYSNASFTVIRDGYANTELQRYYQKIIPNVEELLIRSSSTNEIHNDTSLFTSTMERSRNGSKFYLSEYTDITYLNQTNVCIQETNNVLAYDNGDKLKTCLVERSVCQSLSSDISLTVENSKLLSDNRSKKIFLPLIFDVKEVASDRLACFFYISISPGFNETAVEIGMGLDWTYFPLDTYYEPSLTDEGTTEIDFHYDNSSASFNVDTGNGSRTSNLTSGMYGALLDVLNNYSIDERFEGKASIHMKSDYLNMDELTVDNWTVGYSRKIINPVDAFLFLEMDKFSVPVSDYQRISPTEWTVDVELPYPTMLVFNEDFDPGWRADVSVDGRFIGTVKSNEFAGSSNSFFIDHTGNVSIRIHYDKQVITNYGFIISITFLVITIATTAVFALNQRLGFLGKAKGFLRGMVKR